jgi:hypothetical protein
MSGTEVKMYTKYPVNGFFRHWGLVLGLVKPKRPVRRGGEPKGCGCESC